jgi:hypothetical protein
MKPLLDAQRINLKEVVWLHQDEEMLFDFGGHFRLFANLVNYKAINSSMP